MNRHLPILFFMLSILQIQAQVNRYEEIIRYIGNPSLVEENQLDPHVRTIPFDELSDALAADYNRSGFFQSLDGSWNFKLTDSPLESPEGFHQPGYETSHWDEIEVPGTWQMQGFGHNIYRNVPMEFSPYDPPNVPVVFNPTGFYTREFEIPASWKDRKVILHFDGVKAGYWIWINGKYTGFDKGSMTPAEFDISRYLVEGTNKIAVQVVRWTDGSYLEDQDMWRFAGIYRSVYLYSVPGIHINDYFVKTDLDELYRDATLEIDLSIKNETGDTPKKLRVSAALYDKDGTETTRFDTEIKQLKAKETSMLTIQEEIKSPELWSAEKPNLYTLVLTLEKPSGEILGMVETKVGFRKLEIKDTQMFVNGVPVTIKGVNRHEHDPLLGRTMRREMIEKDFRVMKELNINSIRTSHYPNDPMFYDLADKWGFYICNEVNAECHYGERYFAAQPGWENAFMDRTARYLHRDKNHPSVFMWSMGNECGLAPIHYQMADFVRATDPTRFVYHQTNYPNGDAPFADICGTRYPNPAMLDAIGDTTRRPVILGEYAHSVGNSMGHFDAYWDRMYKYKSLQGGYIWDWVNQSILVDLITTKDNSTFDHEAIIMGNPKMVPGKNGTAIQLSGLDDFVEVSPHKSLNITGNKLTLQTWIYPRGFQGSNTMISKGNRAFSLEQHHEDSLSFTVFTNRKHTVSAYLPKNWNHNWNHVAAVYNGEEILLFINGFIVGTAPASGDIQRTRYEVMIGKNHERDHENTPGYISNAIFDEVMIHTTALQENRLSFYNSEPVTDQLVLWLPFEKQFNKGSFLCYGATPYTSATMDGIIFADRSYQPESWQVKHSHSPVKTIPLDPENGIFRIHNRYHFTNLDEISIGWILLRQGKPVMEGELDLVLEPLHKMNITIPDIRKIQNEGTEHILRIEYKTKHAQQWAESGYEIAFDEFVIGKDIGKKDNDTDQAESKLSISENGELLFIKGDNFNYTFNKESGVLEQIRYDATDFLMEGPRLNVSRPPIVNEISVWTRAEYAPWYEWGLDSLVHELESIYFEQVNDREVLVSVRKNSYSFKERTLQFNNTFNYKIDNTGSLVIDHKVVCHLEIPDRRPSNDIPWFQKIGLEMKLKTGTDHFNWYGKGPFETYPDRKTGAKTGLYSMAVKDIRMPYVITQGFGNHTDVRWLEVIHEDGTGMRFESEKPMNFSVDPYTNMEETWYPYQLKKGDQVTLNLDNKVSGVGGTPVTVRHQFRTYPDEYHYRIRVQPVQK
ncbi:MAG: DUF4981 domain-containing protein [Bacteroidales bacterium]|nr:DUF4981 domain-containing protein [Bacteroidales bacterium]